MYGESNTRKYLNIYVSESDSESFSGSVTLYHTYEKSQTGTLFLVWMTFWWTEIVELRLIDLLFDTKYYKCILFKFISVNNSNYVQYKGCPKTTPLTLVSKD